MNRRRISVAALLASFALLGPMVPAQLASAATGTPPVPNNWGTLPDHPEILFVDVSSDSEIVSVSVTVADGDAQRAVTLARDDTGRWLSDAVVLAELGIHEATFRAVDADGDSWVYSSSIEYFLVPVRGARTMDTAVTYDDQAITAEGQILFYDPRTQTTGALPAGLTPPSVSMDASNVKGVHSTDGPAEMVLDADGRYRLEVKVIQDFGFTANLTAFVHFQATGPIHWQIAGSDSSLVFKRVVTATASVARVTIPATEVKVTYPANSAVTGAVSRKVGDTWKVVSGVTVRAETFNSLTKFGVTGEDGRFKVWLPLRRSYIVRVFGLHPFLKTAAGNEPRDAVTVLVKQQTTLAFLDRKLLATSVFTFRGELHPEHPVLDLSGWVHLETWTGSTWRRIYSVATSESYGEKRVDHPSWKYRLHWLGNDETTAAVSPVVTLSRKDARIVNGKVSPTSLSSGGSVTISGKVQRLSGGRFVPVGNRAEVQLFFFAKGGTKWTYKGSAYTSSTGAFSKKLTATKDGWWSAVWFTTSTKWVNAYSPDFWVNVTSASSSSRSTGATSTPPPLTGVAASRPLPERADPQLRASLPI